MSNVNTIRKGACLTLGVALAIGLLAVPTSDAQVAGGTLDPTTIEKYADPLIIPPAMPRTDVIGGKKGEKKTDYYEIAVRQFEQQILPTGMPMTTVWSYGSLTAPGTVTEGGSFNYPAFTVEAKWQQAVRVKWINDLVDADGKYLPHLLPVDQTLHWANPPGDCISGIVGTDCRGSSQDFYTGPVPIITHVHGAETYEWSDGYPEAWYLPDANNIPASFFEGGSFFDTFKPAGEMATGQTWDAGTAVFEYPNDMDATTLWYHDHTLGMTRLNVYAGPAGFWLIRGGPADQVLNVKGKAAVLPGPAPALGDAPGMDYYEIPIVIQDRSFNADGSLFYPDNRAFFEGLEPDQLQIPFIPEPAVEGLSDVSPIWNPEFFGNTMVVNGRTWPKLEVEARRYRLRFLNGCDSRFLILKLDNGGTIWQIGSDGGFLAVPVAQTELLLGPAERADVIIDFAGMEGASIVLENIGPDDPYGGGEPGIDFDPADEGTTGKVMQFVVGTGKGKDKSTPPNELVLPTITSIPTDGVSIRTLSLNEEESQTVFVSEDAEGNLVFDADSDTPFGPTSALLGTLLDGSGNGLLWNDDITEVPGESSTEVWEIYNGTADAHPIHIHLVQFQVVNRQALLVEDEETVQPYVLDPGTERLPEDSETGFKDTVISYPGEVTRVVARFDMAGLYVWHCHILEHEDNEMMRPYCVAKADGSLPLSCQQHNDN